ncbi:MAG: Ig-like domain repeat protein [Deltaproteobacteria bacterium]|nr:Ig-like domain repeat protein [Deltaproteobacteria bacterium]
MSELFFSWKPAPLAAIATTIIALLGSAASAQTTGVTVIPWDGTSFDDLNPDGSVNLEGLAAVTTPFYLQNPDAFDFVVIATDFPYALSAERELGLHVSIRNDVQGIGRPSIDNGLLMGSPSRLQSVIKLPEIQSRDHSLAMTVLAHEISHRFSFRLQYRDALGALRDDLIGLDSAHWSAFANNGGSFLEGALWRDNGDGTWTAAATRSRYSDFELYAMGLLAPAQVSPVTLLQPAASVTYTKNDLIPAGTTIAATASAVTIDQVISAMGPRLPAAGQRSYRAAFILLSQHAEPNAQALAELEHLRADLEQEFFFLTRGLATIETSVTRTAPSPQPPTDPLAAASAYLRAQQNEDGTFADQTETIVRDTALAAEALALLEGNAAAVSATATPLITACDVAASTVDRGFAHRGLVKGGDAAGLASGCVAGWPNALLGNENAAFGIAPGYAADPFSTAQLVSEAVQLYGDPAIDAAFSFNSPGGLPAVAGAAPRSAASAAFASGLLEAGVEADPRVSSLITTLRAQQNSDGGFGEPVSRVLDTAIVLFALVGRAPPTDVQRARHYLLTRQRADGSFDGSVYTTAAAVRALALSERANLRVVSAYASPGHATESEPITINALIENTGAIESAQTVVRIFDDTGAVRSSDVTLPALLGRIPIQLTATTNDLVGSRALFVVVDPDASVPDLNRADNRFAVPVILDPRPAGPDFVLTSFTTAPTQITETPQSLNASVRIVNQGKQAAAGFLRIRTGADELFHESFVMLAPLEETVVDVTLVFATGVDLVLVASIEAEPVPDAIAGNNTRTVFLRVPRVTNFAAQTVVVPPGATVGTTSTVAVTVRNTGTTASSATLSLARRNETGPEELVAQVLVSLAAGQAQTFPIPWKPDRAGAVTLRAIIDPTGTLQETNEADNIVETVVSVAASTQPNLVVRALHFSPDPPEVESPLGVTVTVANTGDVASSPTTLRLTTGVVGAALADAGTTTVPAIPGQSTADVAISFTPANPGMTAFVAAVDPNNVVAELDESDNERTEARRVLTLPDLALDLAALRVTPASPGANEQWSVSVNIVNRGEREAPATELALDRDGTRTLATVGPIAGGSGRSVSVSLAGVATGTHTLTIIADAGSVVHEADEGNNTASIDVPVQSDRLGVSTRYFSPNGDGVLDSVTVTFERSGATSASVLRADRTIVRTFAATTLGRIVWDGRDDFGRASSDGLYAIVLTGDDAADETHVVLDTNRSSIGSAFRARSAYPRFPAQVAGGDATIRYSPDGRAFAVLVSREDPRDGAYLVDDAGDTARLVVKDPWPRSPSVQFSPSIDAVGFSRDGMALLLGTQGGCCIAPVTTSVPSQILRAAIADGVPSVLVTDTTTLGFRAAGSSLFAELDDQRLWFDALDGSFTANLVALAGDGSSADLFSIGAPVRFSASPDSRFVAVADWQFGERVVRVFDLNGAEVATLTEAETFRWFGEHTIFAAGASTSIDALVLQRWSPEESARIEIGGLIEATYPEGVACFLAESGIGRTVRGEAVVRLVCRDIGDEFAPSAFDGPLTTDFVTHRKGTQYAAGPFATVAVLPEGEAIIVSDSGAAWLAELDGSRVSIPAQLVSEGLVLSPDSTAYYHRGSSSALVSMQNGENLALSLRLIPQGETVTVFGTVSDANLDRYEVHAILPTGRDLTLGQGQNGVADKELAKFSPGVSGTVIVRLTAFDLAGNRREVERAIEYTTTPAIAELRLVDEFMSPNADGVKDTASLAYRVVTPTTVLATVRNAAGATVRTITKSEPVVGDSSLSWDGRNGSGILQPDGDYRISVGNFTATVHVDTVLPIITGQFLIAKYEERDEFDGELYDGFSYEPVYDASDAHLASWPLTVTDRVTGEDMTHLVKRLTTRRQGSVIEIQAANELKRVSPMRASLWRYEVTATDYAGNHSSFEIPLPAMAAFVSYFGDDPRELIRKLGTIERVVPIPGGTNVVLLQWADVAQAERIFIKGVRLGENLATARTLADASILTPFDARQVLLTVAYDTAPIEPFTRGLIWAELVDDLGRTIQSNVVSVRRGGLDLATDCGVSQLEGAPPGGFTFDRGPYEAFALSLDGSWSGQAIELGSDEDGWTPLSPRATDAERAQWPLLPEDCGPPGSGCEDCARAGFPGAECAPCRDECVSRATRAFGAFPLTSAQLPVALRFEFEPARILAVGKHRQVSSCFQSVRMRADDGVVDVSSQRVNLCEAHVANVDNQSIRISETLHYVTSLPPAHATLAFAFKEFRASGLQTVLTPIRTVVKATTAFSASTSVPIPFDELSPCAYYTVSASVSAGDETRTSGAACEHPVVIGTECSYFGVQHPVAHCNALLPDVRPLKISYSLYEELTSLRLDIRDPFGVVVDSVPLPTGAVPFETVVEHVFDTAGRPEGAYALEAVTMNLDGVERVSPIEPLWVDRSLPTVSDLSPANETTLCRKTPPGPSSISVTGTVRDAQLSQLKAQFFVSRVEASREVAFSTETEVSGEILHINRGVFNAAGTVKIEAKDRAGQTACVQLNLPVDSEFRPVFSPESIKLSPNGDGLFDETLVSYAVSETGALRVDLEQEGTVIAPLVAQQAVQLGERSFTLHPSLADGTYQVVARGADTCENDGFAEAKLVIDTVAPAITVDFPAPNDSVGSVFTLAGDIPDADLKRYVVTIAPASDPLNATELASEPRRPIDRTFAVVSTAAFPSGDYLLSISAEDDVANVRVHTVPIHIGDRELIAGLKATPSLFAPDGDGAFDVQSIEIDLLSSAAVLLAITTATDVTVDEVPIAALAPAGKTTYLWNGVGSSGAPISDGRYLLKLIAIAGARQETASVPTEIDRTAPTVSLTAPADDSAVIAPIALAGTVSDAHFSSAEIALDGSLTTTIVDPIGAGPITSIDAAPGPHTISIAAVDRVGHSATLSRRVVVDAAAPVVSIASPLDGAALSAGTIVISGGATDDDRTAVVEVMLSHAGEPDRSLFRAASAPPGTTLASLPVASLQEGGYTLTLKATDRVSRSAEHVVHFSIDRTPPDVLIAAPGADAYVTGTPAVIGTASDDALLGWTLELGTSQTQRVAEGTTSIIDGTLTTLMPLPPDGRYTLRLHARDRAGNAAEVERAFNVDSHAPATVPLTAAVLARQVTLAWPTPSDTDVDRFELLREGAIIATLAASERTHVDAGVPDGEYRYSLVAIDRAGNRGAPSVAMASVDATPPDVSLASPQDGASVGRSIAIVGSVRGDDVTEYRALVTVGSGAATQVASGSGEAIGRAFASFDISTVADGTTVRVRLEARDDAGNTAVTESIVTVDNAPPAAPVLASATFASNDVTLSWTHSVPPDLRGYLVYRDGALVNAPYASGDLRAYAVSGTSYVDVTVPDGTLTYWIHAIDTAGNVSAASNTRVVTVQRRNPLLAWEKPADNELLLGAEQDLLVVSPDRDIASVALSFSGPASGNIGVLTAAPYTAVWSYGSLPPGFYTLLAVATDSSARQTTSSISVRVARTPEAPVLTGTYMAEHVELSWSSVPGASLYEVLRNGAIVATESALSFAEDLPVDGDYSYAVRALGLFDVQGALSDTFVAHIYAPMLSAAAASQSPVTISGSNALAGSTVDIRVDFVSFANVPVTADGTFSASLDLSLGAYGVTAVAQDALGNQSRESQPIRIEVVDEPPPVALSLFFPARTGTTKQLAVSSPVLAGRAPAGAAVTLREGSNVVASTTALSTPKLEVVGTGSILAAALDPAGRVLAVAEDLPENGLHLVSLTSLAAQNAELTSPAELKWDPSGRKLFAIAYDSALVQDVYEVARDGTVTNLTATDSIAESGLATTADALSWGRNDGGICELMLRDGAGERSIAAGVLCGSNVFSADGRALYYVTFEPPFTVRAHAYDRDTESTSALDPTRDYLILQPSPTNRVVAAASLAGEIVLLADGAAPEVVTSDATFDFAFSPDGATLYWVTSVSEIARRSVAGGPIEQLTSDGVVKFGIRVSQDGSEIGYDEDLGGGKILDLSAGATSSLPGNAYWYGWPADGSILIYDGSSLERLARAGSYFAVANLGAGEHVVSADAGGSSTGASILVIDAPPAADLSLTSFRLFPAAPQPGDNVQLGWIVTNPSATNAPATHATITVVAPDGTTTTSRLEVAAVAPGESVGVAYELAPAAPGEYFASLIIDSDGALSETDEQNNRRLDRFRVFEAGVTGVFASLRLDRTGLLPGETTHATLSFTNAGAETEGEVVLTIETPAGVILSTPLSMPVSFGYGETRTFETDLSPPGLGSFVAHARFVGATSTEASETFSAHESLRLAARVALDAPTFMLGDAFSATVSVVNRAQFAAATNIALSTTVVDAVGTVVSSGSTTIPFLGASAELNLRPALALPSAPGVYVLRATAASDGAIAAAEASFAVVGAPRIIVSLAASPATIAQGGSVLAEIEARNAGSAEATTSLTLTHVAPDGVQEIAFSATETLAPGAFVSHSVPLASHAWTLGRHLLLLTESGVLVASTSVTVRDGSPPLVAIVQPVAGAIVQPRVSLVAEASDEGTGVVSVRSAQTTLIREGGSASFGTYAGELTGIAEGPFDVIVLATDADGNIGTDSVPVTIDGTPPAITISGITDGAVVTSATIVYSALDLHLVSVTATLDGSPFASGAEVSTVGTHSLVVTAFDAPLNRSVARVSFTVEGAADTSPPVIVISGVDEAALVAPPVLLAIAVTDESAFTFSALLDGAPYTPGTPVTSDGDHLLVVSATDAFDNSSVATRSFTIDGAAPVVTLSGAADASLVNMVPTITLSASDAHLANVTASLNGAALTLPPPTGPTYSVVLSDANADGPYSYAAVAFDLVGNTGDASVSFVLDRTPPSITIDGVAEGALAAGPVALTVTVIDAHSTSLVLTLDGAPYTEGAPISADGAHTLAATATDAAGNVSNASRTFSIDAVAPALTLSGVADGALVRVPPSVQLTAFDTNLASVSAALHGAPLSLPPVTSSAYSASLSGAAGDGSHTYAATASDGVGRATHRTLSFTLDATPPSITIAGVADGALVAGPVSLTVMVTDAHSTSLALTLDGAPYAQGTPISSDGGHTLVAIATDAAGNEATASRTFTIDAVAPTLTLSGVSDGALVRTPPAVQLDAFDANLATVTATLDASPLSLPPVTGAAFSSALASVTADGAHTYSAAATDAVGRATSRSVSFTLDATPPTIVIAGVAEDALVAGPVSLTVTVTDAHDTSLTLALDGAPYVEGAAITAAGPHTFVASATDAAGNAASATRHFEIDAIAPALALSGVAAGALVNAVPVIELTASDAHLSTVAATLDSVPLSLPPVTGQSFSATLATAAADGAHTYAATATDAVGRSTTRSLAFTLDRTPPAIAITGVAEGALVAGPVSLTVTVTDANPGTLTLTLNGASYVQGTPVTAGGAHALLAHAVDAAGNVTDATRHFTIDAVAPTVALAGVAAGAFVKVVPSVTLSANDAHLASVTATLDGSALALGPVTPPSFTATLAPVTTDGSHSYAATATDAVGRSASTSLAFTLDRVAPVIAFAGVADGATVPAPVRVDVTINDTALDPTKTVILLDGAPYTSGSPISAPGLHHLSAHAEDRAGNASDSALSFTVSSPAGLEPNFPYTVCSLDDIELEDHALIAGKPAAPGPVSCSSSSNRPPHCSNAVFGGNVASDDDVDLSKTQVLGHVLARGSVTLDKSRVDGNVYARGHVSRDHRSVIGGAILPLATNESLCTCGPTAEDLITDRSDSNDNVRLLSPPWRQYYDSARKILTVPNKKKLVLPPGRLLLNEVRLGDDAALLAPSNETTELTIIRPPDELDLRAPLSSGGTLVVILGNDRCDDDDDEHHDGHHGDDDDNDHGHHDDDNDHHYSHHGGHDHHHGHNHHCSDRCHDEHRLELRADGSVSVFAPGIEVELEDGTIVGRFVVRALEAEDHTYILDPTPTPLPSLQCEVMP